MTALDCRERETVCHSQRVALYSVLVGLRIGLEPSELETLYRGALLHDIGKIGIPDEVLLKPGKLTVEEFAVIKQHTRIGYEILKESPSRYLQMGAVIALGHHEKYDGSGYPHGLIGDNIPLVARIVAVADVFDALIQNLDEVVQIQQQFSEDFFG